MINKAYSTWPINSTLWIQFPVFKWGRVVNFQNILNLFNKPLSPPTSPPASHWNWFTVSIYLETSFNEFWHFERRVCLVDLSKHFDMGCFTLPGRFGPLLPLNHLGRGYNWRRKKPSISCHENKDGEIIILYLPSYSHPCIHAIHLTT